MVGSGTPLAIVGGHERWVGSRHGRQDRERLGEGEIEEVIGERWAMRRDRGDAISLR